MNAPARPSPTIPTPAPYTADHAAPAVAFARADLAPLAERFARAGCAVRQPDAGILAIAAPVPATRAVVLSVGIHGDETAPVEMVAALLDDLARRPGALAVDLLLVVGNPAAIEAGRRFVEVDLNRVFRADRGDLAAGAECRRADTIMRAVDRFYHASAAPQRWHLDLHTTIRPSLYPAFAVVPDAGGDAQGSEQGDGNGNEQGGALLDWLGAAGIEAAVLNRHLAGTFSGWTALEHGAAGATVELGSVAAFGTNDLARFAATATALEALLTGRPASAPAARPPVFRVVTEIVKHSAAFRMAFDAKSPNFSRFEPGQKIAEDGAQVYRAGELPEYVLFPNPDVRIGLRAGLMAIRQA